jgi:AmiR/NasT family two-component response regulator
METPWTRRGYQVVGVAVTGTYALHHAQTLPPDVVLTGERLILGEILKRSVHRGTLCP